MRTIFKAFLIFILFAHGIYAKEKDFACKKKDHHLPDLNKFESSFAYWNDNFVFEDLTKLKNKKNHDDFETGSFLFQLSYEKEKHVFILDNYFNILTNKKSHYRVDLFSSRFAIERKIPNGTAEIGMGLVASGDFGGSDIQNGYHKMFGYVPVHLPYDEKGKCGMTFMLRVKPSFYKNDIIDIKGYLSNYYRTEIIPNNFRAGLDINIRKYFHSGKRFVNSQFIFGYTEYYNTDKFLGDIFGNGITWGLLMSYGISNYLFPSLWLTNNQYGIKQLQFGFSFSFGWNGKRMYDLNDFTFP